MVGKKLCPRMVVGLLASWAFLQGSSAQAQCTFIRGDLNATGTVDLNDAVDILAYIFLGETVPPCYDAADANDNGLVELSDYVYMVKWIFSGGPPPPAPYPAAGIDPTPGTTVPTAPDSRFKFKFGE